MSFQLYGSLIFQGVLPLEEYLWVFYFHVATFLVEVSWKLSIIFFGSCIWELGCIAKSGINNIQVLLWCALSIYKDSYHWEHLSVCSEDSLKNSVNMFKFQDENCVLGSDCHF